MATQEIRGRERLTVCQCVQVIGLVESKYLDSGRSGVVMAARAAGQLFTVEATSTVESRWTGQGHRQLTRGLQANPARQAGRKARENRLTGNETTEHSRSRVATSSFAFYSRPAVLLARIRPVSSNLVTTNPLWSPTKK